MFLMNVPRVVHGPVAITLAREFCNFKSHTSMPGQQRRVAQEHRDHRRRNLATKAAAMTMTCSRCGTGLSRASSFCEPSATPATRGGDVVLQLNDGQKILAHSGLLAIASPVLEDALLHCGAATTVCEDHDLPLLKVEGSFEAWTELLRFLYHPAVAGRHLPLSPVAAFKILPVAHTYDLSGLLDSCVETVQLSSPPLLPAHARATSTDGTSLLGPAASTKGIQVRDAADRGSSEPDLLEWLVLADSVQYEPLIHACLEMIGQQHSEGPGRVLRSILSGRRVRGLVQRLRPTTLMALLNLAAQLPTSFQGIRTPDFSKPPTYVHKVEASAACGYRTFSSRLRGSLLLLPDFATNAVELVDLTNHTTRTLRGHAGPVTAVDFCGPRDRGGGGSSGGFGGAGHSGVGSLWDTQPPPSLVLSGSRDGTLRLWHLPTGACRLTIDRHGDEILAACCCGAAGQLAASASWSGLIKIWDLYQGSHGAAAPVAGAGLHTRGTLGMRQGSEGGSTESGAACWGCLEGHTGAVLSMCPSYDGRLLLSSSLDKTAKMWDLRESGGRRCVRTLAGHGDTVWSASVDAQSSVAVTAAADGLVRVWDMGSGRCTSVLAGHKERVLTAQVDSAGTTALSFGCHKPQDAEGFSIRVWDLSREVQAQVYASLPRSGSMAVKAGAASDDLGTVALVVSDISSGQRGPGCACMEVQVWSA